MIIGRHERAKLAEAKGLYRPETERDGCGVGFIADVEGRRSREVVDVGLAVLEGLAHRGAVGSDPLSGDGCGALLQIPHELLARELCASGVDAPLPGHYGVGQVFLPIDSDLRLQYQLLMESRLAREGFELLAWREVPVRAAHCGPTARESLPCIAQIFVTHADPMRREANLDRKLYLARKAIERDAAKLRAGSLYVCSLSSRTIVYKGLLLPDQLARFYPDLSDPLFASALCLVHQRFSTNTFPSWEKAHPYRMIAHNGEINTLRGNINRMRARESLLAGELRELAPILDQNGSDSAILDNALEFLTHTGRSLPHALMMTVPEAWESRSDLSPALRAFYRYHGCVMEPWDGPALIAFTDGSLVGGALDRNGLRPARYLVTSDGMAILASEAGVVEPGLPNVKAHRRLRPGEMILVDTVARRVVANEAIKASVSARRPYSRWIAENLLVLDELAEPEALAAAPHPALRDAQRVHGYTIEDLNLLLVPMAKSGHEPLGAMGDDAALAVLSDRPQPLFNYFKQLFAQVTNPPIDPVRETLVMSLRTRLGERQDICTESPRHCRQLELTSPILTHLDLERIRALDLEGLRSTQVPILFPAAGGGLARGLADACEMAVAAARAGSTILILSDRGHDEGKVPIPSLLAVSAVHHHLIRQGLRSATSLVIESGEPREIMHCCLLIGYGASAIHPYLAFQSIEQLWSEDRLGPIELHAALAHYRAALEEGLLKVLSKMGISTLESYQEAQCFEAIGLGPRVIADHFPGTISRLGGIEMEEIEREYLMRQHDAYQVDQAAAGLLEGGGRYRWRRDGERHQLTPNVVGLLQHAVRSASYSVFKKYSRIVDEHTTRGCDVRGLLELEPRSPVPIDEVEPTAEIVKRFRTGAMSLGSLSREAHETLAIAMNRLGGRSNSGEGGEDPARYPTRSDGESRNSAIKQVASGRFGVTLSYLLSADELQIKIAQGAKPGEGGQLPGHKVDPYIARIRHSTPGVDLISPPPHHDIYSIEDLAQLIHDLKRANPRADVSVKLVSQVGVGTVAAGVAKTKADHIVISGHSGGTGASPLGSIKHAGVPWELGLAEAQQVLMVNDLRSRVTLEVDGQLKTGRDVVIGALLGAERFAFGTAALIASGCILMRVCHLNTCPVGVATQDPELRRRFAGLPEHVINFMLFVAEEVREWMARLGFRRMDEMIGRTDCLRPRSDLADHWKARRLDLSRLLHAPSPAHTARRRTRRQDHAMEDALERRLLEGSLPALVSGERVRLSAPIRNHHRSIGTLLSSELVRRHGAGGLAPRSIVIHLAGSAGQSFGAFLAPGIDLTLRGLANDSVAKGMSGGRISIVAPLTDSPAGFGVVVGNVALYGATGGSVFIQGAAGERFAVRNSGATAVVEGVGDHACEYMTGGTVVVLGPTGRNFAAGMSGGVAYVLDEDGGFPARCNRALVELDRPGEADEAALHQLLCQHCASTSSPRGWRILSGWHVLRSRFVRVVPHGYRAAMAIDPGTVREAV